MANESVSSINISNDLRIVVVDKYYKIYERNYDGSVSDEQIKEVLRLGWKIEWLEKSLGEHGEGL